MGLSRSLPLSPLATGLSLQKMSTNLNTCPVSISFDHFFFTKGDLWQRRYKNTVATTKSYYGSVMTTKKKYKTISLFFLLIYKNRWMQEARSKPIKYLTRNTYINIDISINITFDIKKKLSYAQTRKNLIDYIWC